MARVFARPRHPVISSARRFSSSRWARHPLWRKTRPPRRRSRCRPSRRRPRRCRSSPATSRSTGTPTPGRSSWKIPRLDTEVLHLAGLATGLGSNDIGLDRAAVTGSRIVRFERVGLKVLMVQPNYAFRSSSSNPAEVADVRDAFAPSVLWGFTVVAASDSGRRVLVELNDFLLRDADNISQRLVARELQARREPQRDQHAEHAELPEEHRAGGRADLRAAAGRERRPRRRGVSSRGSGRVAAHRAGGVAPDAPVVHRTARHRGLHQARL